MIWSHPSLSFQGSTILWRTVYFVCLRFLTDSMDSPWINKPGSSISLIDISEDEATNMDSFQESTDAFCANEYLTNGKPIYNNRLSSTQINYEDSFSKESVKNNDVSCNSRKLSILNVVSRENHHSTGFSSMSEDKVNPSGPEQDQSEDKLLFNNIHPKNLSLELTPIDPNNDLSKDKLLFESSHSKHLSNEKLNKLQNDKKYYELEIKKERKILENFKKRVRSLNIDTLPDKGASLRCLIEKQISKVKELNEQILSVSLNIVKETLQTFDSKDIQFSDIVDLTKDHLNVSDKSIYNKPSASNVRSRGKHHSSSLNSSSKRNVTSPNKDHTQSEEKLLLGSVSTEFETLDTIDLTRNPSMDASEIGEAAQVPHQVEQFQTVETLERLHKFLETSNREQEVSDPVALKISLLPHQKVGLSWLLRRESEVPCGGILADDMGLGKTLSIISLILKDMENHEGSAKNDSSGDEDNEAFMGRKKLSKGKSLIVCLASVLGQWSSEVSSKVKAETLSVYTYHGNKREMNPLNLSRYDMVLTTYAILQYENNEDPGPLLNIHWRRVVLDEAHVIRNHKCKTAQAVFALQAKRRWALTGTPIHNRKEDYFSLLKFLKCKPFDNLAIWKSMVDNRGQQGMQRLHLLTKSLLLRRTKEEIQKEGGLKELSAKEFSLIEIILDSEEYKIYEKISYFSAALLTQYIHEKAERENLLCGRININNPQNIFEDYPELSHLYNQMIKKKGGVKTHHILVLLLRLRQICSHPSLVTSFFENEELGEQGIENSDRNDLSLIDRMMNLVILPDTKTNEEPKEFITIGEPFFRKDRYSSKVREIINIVTRILEKGNDKLIIVSQWTSFLEIIYSFLSKLNIKSTSLNGSIPVKERIGIINDFNTNDYGPKVMLLSLTAGGTGLNLVGANHLLLVDNHWNPQLEAQACDRIYRVGQTKTVQIYKFVCVNTIEERIVKLQKQKLEIAKGVLTGSSKIHTAKLTLHDLKLLFNIV